MEQGRVDALQDGFDVVQAVFIQDTGVPGRSRYDHGQRPDACDGLWLELGDIEERQADGGVAGDPMVEGYRTEVDVGQDGTLQPVACGTERREEGLEGFRQGQEGLERSALDRID